MVKFGKAGVDDAAHITRAEEEVRIETSQKVSVDVTDDAEDKFFAESIAMAENLFKEKKVWTDINREKQEDRDKGIAPGPAAPAAPAAPAPGSLAEMLSKKGDGKGGFDQQQDASLRITNLSEDVKEGDLQELFGQFGRLQRVYLAKHMDTFLSKGFAFVTYYNRDDGQKAINKLNGHGYDNLIMKVEWAKPRGA